MTNFEKVTHFFECDKNIKKLMQEMCPDENFKCDENYIIKHADKMYENFKEIKKMMLSINKNFNFGDMINEKLERIECKIIETKPNYEALLSVYNNLIANMNEDLVKKANEDICGFYLLKNTKPLYTKANTINEILHIMHKEIENDETIFSSLPVVAKKEGKFYPSIACYGKDTELAKKIYNNFSIFTETGKTDYISIMSIDNDHCIVMIRDLGHALTLDIKENTLPSGEKRYLTNYFIPKTCNKAMLQKNLTPFGLRAIKENENFATGVFESNKTTFGIRTLLFANNVPTDFNIPSYGQKEEECITTSTIPDILNKLSAESLILFAKTNEEFISNYKPFASFLKDKISQRQSEMKIEDLAKGMEIINNLEGVTKEKSAEIKTR